MSEQGTTKSQYWPVMIANLIAFLLQIFGGLAIIILIISAFLQSPLVTGGLNNDKEEDALVEQRLNEQFPELQIGTADLSVEESVENIVSLFEENNVQADTYWMFRTVISQNAQYFVDQVGSQVFVDSPNQLGKDTKVLATDGVTHCVIWLRGDLTYECE